MPTAAARAAEVLWLATDTQLHREALVCPQHTSSPGAPALAAMCAFACHCFRAASNGVYPTLHPYVSVLIQAEAGREDLMRQVALLQREHFGSATSSAPGVGGACLHL